MTLYYYEETTMKEIGLILGVVESRISQIHASAVLHLRARLADFVRHDVVAADTAPGIPAHSAGKTAGRVTAPVAQASPGRRPLLPKNLC